MPEFFFDDRIHDNSVKTVLGHQIHAGGMKDGEEVLDILARDPHTAHHISYELAQRFVSDNPPAALVDRMAQTFLEIRRRYPRSPAHHDLFARILVQGNVSRQDQDAL